MPSSYTASLRFEQQFTGENTNTWGQRLNTLFGRADFSIAGQATIPLTGVPYALTSSNTADDEARASTLIFTGTGGSTVTIPSVPKSYIVHNKTAAAVTLTAGGLSLPVDAGDIVPVRCNGSDVLPGVGYADSGGNLLSLKQYIAAQALAAGTGASALVSDTPRTRDSAATPHRIPIPLLTANLLDGPLTAPTVPKTLSARHIVTTTTPLGMSDCDPEFGGC